MRSKRTGRAAGWKDTAGHLNIKIDHRDYLVHRLIWLRQTGSWPTGVIDHINGEKTDNRLVNLRMTTQSVNCQNLMAAYQGSASGVLGVSKSHRSNEWIGTIRVNKKLIHLGSFTTKEAAYDEYLNAKTLVHPEATLIQGRITDLSKFSERAVRNLKKFGHWPDQSANSRHASA